MGVDSRGQWKEKREGAERWRRATPRVFVLGLKKIPQKFAPAKAVAERGRETTESGGDVKALEGKGRKRLGVEVPNLKAIRESLALEAGGKEGMGLAPGHYKFDVQNLIEMAAEHWPNVSKICHALNISRQTFYDCKKNDPAFALAVHEIDAAYADMLERNMLELGSQKSSFTFNDRIAYLRAHRPELYNPARKVIIEGRRLDEGEAGKRRDLARGAVDAQIVEATLDRTERKQLKRGELDIVGDGSSTPGAGGA